MLFLDLGLRDFPYGGNDFLEVAEVGRFAVAVFEFDFFRSDASRTHERRYFERYALKGSVAAESSGGRRIRSVERFEMFVSERVDGEGGHGVVGSFGIYLREGVRQVRFYIFGSFASDAA